MSSAIVARRPLAERLFRWAKGTAALAAEKVVAWLPLAWSGAVAKALYGMVWPFSGKMRRTALENLRIAYGDKLTKAERRRIARAMIYNLVRWSLAAFWLDRATPEQVRAMCEVEGVEHLREALSAGRGAIALGAHIGPFPLIGARLSIEGIPYCVVVRRASDERLEREFCRIRRKYGIDAIYRGTDPIHILGKLRRGWVVHLFLDQHTLRRGAIVRFFGKPVPTFLGPALLARRGNIPVLPIFMRPGQEAPYCVEIGRPIKLPRTDDPEMDMVVATQIFTAYVEARIRANPSWWTWQHRRWLRPTDQIGLILPGLEAEVEAIMGRPVRGEEAGG